MVRSSTGGCTGCPGAVLGPPGAAAGPGTWGGVRHRAGPGLLLVAEQVRERVLLLRLLTGLGDQVVHAHVLRGARVVAVRQVLGGAVRLRRRGLRPHLRVGRVRGLRGLRVQRLRRGVGARGGGGGCAARS
ncbi:hypothetical protein GCM10020256_37880 [Streptomyces thermocoprophilus]